MATLLVSGQPIRPRNEVAALQLLSSKCRCLLEEYSYGEGDDERLLNDAVPMVARKRWAALLRVSHRSILKRTLHRAQELAQLVAVVEYQGSTSRGALPAVMDGSAKNPAVLEAWGAALQRVVEAKADPAMAVEALRPHFSCEAAAALFLAASDDFAQQVKMLLGSRLVRADIADRRGNTPLHIAAKNGAKLAVQELLQSGNASVNCRALGDDGNTALHHAAASGWPSIVKQLLEAQADPEVVTMGAGLSALHYAAFKGHLPVVDLLLKQGGAYPKAATPDGVTPLHAVAFCGSVGVARLLVAAKADASQRTTTNGFTPSQAAKDREQHELAAYLASVEGRGAPADEALQNGVSTQDKDAEAPLWERPPAPPGHEFPAPPFAYEEIALRLSHEEALEAPLPWRELPLLAADTLPHLETRRELEVSEVEAFHATGCLLISQLFDRAIIELFRPHINLVALPGEPRDERVHNKDFVRLTNLRQSDEACRRLIESPALASMASQLLGDCPVTILEDSLFFKEPGDGPTRWHQDHCGWPVDSDRTITFWLPLVDIPRAAGPLQFAVASHLEGSAAACFAEAAVSEKYEIAGGGDLRVGDVTAHAGWTIHGAPSNLSTYTREALAVSFVADGAQQYSPELQSRYVLCQYAHAADRRTHASV